MIEHVRDGVELSRVEQFQQEVVFQGSRYKVGSDLVSLQEGLGYERNDPDWFDFDRSIWIVCGRSRVWGAHTLWNHWIILMTKMREAREY